MTICAEKSQTATYSELLIGCGKDLRKKMGKEGDLKWHNMTTLDMNEDFNPDVVWDLENLPLPFEDNSFDEIHAYEVLEHCGRQGDWRFFFDQFSDFWRILKPGGYFFATMPAPGTVGVWCDPGHCRSFAKETLLYLDQVSYTNILPGLPWVVIGYITDYRFYYKADFQTVECGYCDESLRFVLQAKGKDNGKEDKRDKKEGTKEWKDI